jgi:hypothetical protein
MGCGNPRYCHRHRILRAAFFGMRDLLVPVLSESVFGIALAVSALMFTGCGDPKAVGQVNSSVHAVLLNGEDQPLRDDFNRDQDFVRLMLLVDPRCPECLRGLADMGDDVLAKLPKGARIQSEIPVLGRQDFRHESSSDTSRPRLEELKRARPRSCRSDNDP